MSVIFTFVPSKGNCKYFQGKNPFLSRKKSHNENIRVEVSSESTDRIFCVLFLFLCFVLF